MMADAPPSEAPSAKRAEQNQRARPQPIAIDSIRGLQEHEARDALLACRGQLRLAPSGHVIGIDLHAALPAASGLVTLAELLPAAEAGLVEPLSSDRVWEDGP